MQINPILANSDNSVALLSFTVEHYLQLAQIPSAEQALMRLLSYIGSSQPVSTRRYVAKLQY